MEADGYRFFVEQQAQWRQHLATEGFVVIANWLPQQLCDNYVGQFWGIIETLAEGRVNRDDPATQVLSKNYPPVLHGGMIQYVGHSRAQWELRKRSKELFARLWRTDDLKSSFDGFCFMNGRRNYQQVPIDSFLHSDQSPTKDFIWSYQGVLTLTDSGPDQGGFVVVPGSNRKHRDYFESKGLGGNKKNWFLVPQQDKEGRILGQPVKIDSKAGDYILFDSRTFHCNTVPRAPVLRVCVYICMIPADRVPQKTQVLRRLAAKNRRVSNHHPGDGFRTFPTLPRFLPDKKEFKKLLETVNDCPVDPEIQSLL